MRLYKIFKAIQFKKVPMNLFINKYDVIDGKIKHIDFICDLCKKQDYEITDYIYFHISFKGYCEKCYSDLVNKKVKIENGKK